MDISDTIIPNSQQINAEDLLASARTVTITQVEKGSAEQPVFLHVAEFPGRTFRPGKSMRRVLVSAWGPEASAYVGRKLTIYNDPTIRFGKDVTGGIRISHMSHLDKPLTVALTVTRGKRAPFVVQPLKEAPAPSRADRVQVALSALQMAETTRDVDIAWGRIIKGGLNDAPELVKARDQRLTQLGGAA